MTLSGHPAKYMDKEINSRQATANSLLAAMQRGGSGAWRHAPDLLHTDL
jgi:hypothetical protein